MIVVDTNVLLDLIDETSAWSAWSRSAFASTAEQLAVNHVIFAEMSGQFASLDDELAFFRELGIDIVMLNDLAAFRAGKAHLAYRAAGGKRETILADFLIGGHAVSLGAKLLTRDRQRFATYFPDLTLITPETHP
ncbi:DNA-binding protein [Sphingomonas sp. HMWF008]|nr:DNA-binding protein [Sphingomonas sp. HMWF008]